MRHLLVSSLNHLAATGSTDIERSTVAIMSSSHGWNSNGNNCLKLAYRRFEWSEFGVENNVHPETNRFITE